jgi:hypothetical protein
MSPETREQSHDRTAEEVLVRTWRRRQFLALGFSLRQAQRLTKAPVDLGDMRRLIAAGCPHETAQRILL